MTTAEKEERIMRLGPLWISLMKTLRASRDAHINRMDEEFQRHAISDDSIKNVWYQYHHQHYGETLDLILDLAKRRRSN